MTDPYAETDEWPLPRYSGDSKVPATFHPSTQITPLPAQISTHSPERAVSEGSDADNAQGALVERLAEAMWGRLTLPLPNGFYDARIEAVKAVVAAEVEAAVSVVRAEAQGWREDSRKWKRYAMKVEAQGRAVRRDGEGHHALEVRRYDDRLDCVTCSCDSQKHPTVSFWLEEHWSGEREAGVAVLRNLIAQQAAALSDPTTHDQAGGE